MAQTVNVSPVQIQDDGSSQRFIATLNNQMEAKRQQENAVRQAKLKQAEDNNRIFGDSMKNIQQWAAIDGVSPVAINEVVSRSLAELTNAYKRGDANFGVMASMLTTDAAMKFNSLKGFKTNVDDTVKELKEMFPSVMEDNIKAAANRYFFKQEQLPDGTVRTGVNWDNLPKIKELIKGEIISNPSRYADIASATNTAFNMIGSVRGEEFKESKKLDPTGTKITSVGVEDKKYPWEVLKTIKHPDSGMDVRVPAIEVTSFDKITKPDGTPYSVISDQAYNSLIASTDKNFSRTLIVKADDMINDHNTGVVFNHLRRVTPSPVSDEEVTRKAREIVVGANDRSTPSLESSFPGFINKYLPSNMEAFQRISATKLLSDMNRYGKGGVSTQAAFDFAVDATKPAGGGSGGGSGSGAGSGTGAPTIDLVGEVERTLGGAGSAPLSNLDSFYMTEVLNVAQRVAGGAPVSAADIELVKLKSTPDNPRPVGFRFVRDIERDDKTVLTAGKSFKLGQSSNIPVAKNVLGQKGASAAARQVQQPAPKPQTKNTIEESFIPTAARNAGYSVDEYRRLLEQKGIRIIKK